MNKEFRYFLIVFVIFALSLTSVKAEGVKSLNLVFSVDSVSHLPDSLTLSLKPVNKKDLRQKKKDQRKSDLKASHSRLFIHGAYVFANLNTKVTFNPPGSIIRVVIGLEDNLGLPANSSFFSGSAIYRITPSSGIYVNYYGFNRSKNLFTDRDYYWNGDTIPAGTMSNVYFKTQVFSAGYILSILKKPDSFLGAYLNFYVMPVSLGLKTDITHKDYNLSVVAPLPNVGLIAMFKLTKWLTIAGNMGFFSLSTRSLGGYIQDINISLPIRITRWLNLSVNYQKFFVHVLFPDQEIDTYVDYDFKGPAVGLTIRF